MFGAAAVGDAVIEAQRLLNLDPAAHNPDVSCPETSSREQFFASIPLPDPSRCIRVLDLHPADNLQHNSPLTGSLRVVDLDATPSFTVLSYVWGAMADPCDTILCQPHGHRLEIPASCHSALWSLRRRFGALTIWVDSVCINQGDEQEKAVQIPLMSRIYSGSERMFVWLGPGNRTSDRAMDYLAEFAKLRARLPFDLVASPPCWPRGHGRVSRHMWLARLRTLTEAPARLRMLLTHRWMARHVRLDELFARAWIQRAWTFQELILSPNPVVLCGDKMLAWEDLAEFVLAHEDYFSGVKGPGNHLGILGQMPRASADALAHWSSTVMLWLTFHRHGSTSNNLVKLLALDDANHVARIVKFVVGFLLGLLISVGYAVAFAKLTFPAARAMTGSPTEISGIFIVLYGYFYLVVVGLSFPYLVAAMGLCWHVLFGLRPPWYSMGANQYQETGPRMVHVEAIRVALRERAVALPHDKAFSMLAILKTLGSEDVEVDYRQHLSECFKHLFVAIVKLHPPALLMLCDAGLSLGSDQQIGPSWVPNWMEPPPNAGVSFRLHIALGTRPDDTNFGPGDQYQIKGNSLHICGARELGTIVFPSPSEDGQTLQSGDSLQRVCGWYRFIRWNTTELPLVRTATSSEDDVKEEEGQKSRYRDSVVFAALEGLLCPANKMQPVYAGVVNNEGTAEKKFRPPHEAPLDFSEWSKDFYDFLEFKAMLDDAYSVDLAQGHDMASWIHRNLDENRRAARYWRRLMVKLAKDDRQFVAVAVASDYPGYTPRRSHWIGTAPLAAVPGDRVFLLPKLESCMVLRSTSRDDEFRVVGCALLPMAHGNWQRNITLV